MNNKWVFLETAIKENTVNGYTVINPTTSVPNKAFYRPWINKNWIEPKGSAIPRPNKSKSVKAISKPTVEIVSS
ncbi:MAG: hypothetical protein VB018_15830 [Lachnospiraceae bacterium]|nr:hypothetical protein [Lachnospiraceae bacterium]